MRNDDLVNKIKRLERDVADLKASQFTGFDTVQSYVTELSSATWDVSWTASFSSPITFDSATILAKFTASRQVAPFAILHITALIDDTTYYLVGEQNDVSMNDIVPDTFGNYSPTATPNAPNELSWYSSVTATVSGRDVKLKFRVYGTDTGTMAVKFDGSML